MLSYLLTSRTLYITPTCWNKFGCMLHSYNELNNITFSFFYACPSIFMLFFQMRIYIFFLCGTPIAGILFYGHLANAFIFIISSIHVYNNNGRWRHSEKVNSNDLLFLEKSQTADRRSHLIHPFDPSIRFSTPQKKNRHPA